MCCRDRDRRDGGPDRDRPWDRSRDRRDRSRGRGRDRDDRDRRGRDGGLYDDVTATVTGGGTMIDVATEEG